MTTKDKLIHTVDIETIKEFKTLTRELSINRSALIENFIKRWIKENKDKNK